MLSNEWLEELFCHVCGTSRWCHVTKHNREEHTVRWAPRDLWEQEAHVDPVVANPTVSEFTRRQARRLNKNPPMANEYLMPAESRFSIGSTSAPRPRKSEYVAWSLA